MSNSKFNSVTRNTLQKTKRDEPCKTSVNKFQAEMEAPLLQIAFFLATAPITKKLQKWITQMMDNYQYTPSLRPREDSIPEKSKPKEKDQHHSRNPPSKEPIRSRVGSVNVPRPTNSPASFDAGHPRTDSIPTDNPVSEQVNELSAPLVAAAPFIPLPTSPAETTKPVSISRRAKILAAGTFGEYDGSSDAESTEAFKHREQIQFLYAVEELSKRKRYLLLGMKPTYSPSIQALKEAEEPEHVYDEDEDLAFHLDHSGFQVLKDVTHMFLQIGSRTLDRLVPDHDLPFAHKYEIICGDSGQRLYMASETLEALNRDGCCTDRSAQRYELVVISCEGKGVFAASRHDNVITFSDFTKDIAFMVRTDEKPGPHPQNFVIKDAETNQELCRLIPNPFQDKGEYEVLMGDKDNYVGKISSNWKELGGGEHIPQHKHCLGLKCLRNLDSTIKGYLIGALFNTYFTFDRTSEVYGDHWAHGRRKTV